MKYTLLSFILLCCIISSQSIAQTRLDINNINSNDYHTKALFYQQQASDILNNANVDDLSDNRFYRYMTALRSEANCHYMLDNYRKLGDIANQYQTLLSFRKNLDKDIRLRLSMYGDKIWGSYYYGQTEHDGSAYYVAESYYLKSLKNSSYDRVHTNIIYKELSQLYYKWGLSSKDSDFFKLAHKYLSLLDSDAEIISQQAMCLARMGQFEESSVLAIQYFSQALENINSSIKLLKKDRDIYVESLRKKGKILMLQRDRLNIDCSKEIIDCYNKYISHHKKTICNNLKRFSNDSEREQYWLAFHQFLYDCVRVGDYAPDMIYDLVLFSKGFLIELKHNTKATDYSWKDIKKVLKKEDCAIEFVAYNGANESRRMGALVVKKNSRIPKFIDIGSIDSIMNLKLINRKPLKHSLSSYNEKDINAIFNDSTIFNCIWTPALLKEIDNSKNIYFSPDGFIHQLAIEYMAPEELNCFRLSSTRMLLKPRKIKTSKILLCGDINYHSSQESSLYTNRTNDINGYYTMSHRKLNIESLPGTKIEIDSISNLLKKSFLNVETLTNVFATENRFCHLASLATPIVHIATHGYFIGTNNFSTDLKPILNDKSMSESGILMAGVANNINNSFFNPSNFDGLLTAKEMADENFKYIDLMILSACQTGMGFITDDGVYGIIRGLKESGVGAIIASLWTVNDFSTSELMKRFYTELIADPEQNVHNAFNRARQSMIKNGEFYISKFNQASLTNKQTKVTLNTPFHTNAFILIDAW